MRHKKTVAADINASEFIGTLFPDHAVNNASPKIGELVALVSTPQRFGDSDVPLWPPRAYHASASYAEELYVAWNSARVVEHEDRNGHTRIGPRASNDCFGAQHFLMLDDIGTSKAKVQLPRGALECATYVLETSKGNFQVGYKLKPALNADENAQLRDALIRAKYSDAGALRTAGRWCRVPGSLNSKPGRNNWRAKLTQWQPKKAYDLGALAELLALDLDFSIKADAKRTSHSGAVRPDDPDKYNDRIWKYLLTIEEGGGRLLTRRPTGKGFFGIVCPWYQEHSNASIHGTDYAPGFEDEPPSFSCMHDSCRTAGRDTKVFIQWARVQMGEAPAFKFETPAPTLPTAENTPETSTEEEDAVGMDLNDLLDADVGEVPWIIQDVLTYGAHLLVGRPKGGKSWLTLDMAYAVGNAGSFADKQAVRGEVLWISGEDTKESLARRLKVRGERVRGVTVMTMESLKAERANWEDCSFESWLRAYLEQHPAISLVIMDTHETIEAVWQMEQIDEKRSAGITQQAYQKSRVYDTIGQETQTAIVLVHHARKRNGKEVTDYHELVNLPLTVVAGATASIVLADPQDKDVHDEDDFKRVLAIRGRHIIHDTPLLIELKDGRAKYLGVYSVIMQTGAQSEVFEMIEALLEESDKTSITEIAAAMGKHKNTIQGAIQRAGRSKAGWKWKGRELDVKPGRNGGISWKR